MRVSIFIKSWKADLGWLRYCLRFLATNWAEKRSDVVVMLDEDCRGIDLGEYEGLYLHRVYTRPWGDGYSHAMYCKACADKYCMGDAIALLDSDTMLLKRTDASVFFEELPIIPYITYEEHFAAFAHSPWQKVTERVMKMRPANHYMPVMPILYWAQTFHDLRRYIVEQHNANNFEEVVRSDEPFDPAKFAEHPISFVDYDCLGFYAATFEPQRYVFRHLKMDEAYNSPFKQFHSWTEWNEETPKILDRCLAEAVAA